MCLVVRKTSGNGGKCMQKANALQFWLSLKLDQDSTQRGEQISPPSVCQLIMSCITTIARIVYCILMCAHIEQRRLEDGINKQVYQSQGCLSG